MYYMISLTFHGYPIPMLKGVEQVLIIYSKIGPSEVRAPAFGVAHAGGERSVHY